MRCRCRAVIDGPTVASRRIGIPHWLVYRTACDADGADDVGDGASMMLVKYRAMRSSRVEALPGANFLRIRAYFLRKLSETTKLRGNFPPAARNPGLRGRNSAPGAREVQGGSREQEICTFS